MMGNEKSSPFFFPIFKKSHGKNHWKNHWKKHGKPLHNHPPLMSTGKTTYTTVFLWSSGTILLLEFYSAFPLDGVRVWREKWAVHFYCFHKKIVGGKSQENIAGKSLSVTTCLGGVWMKTTRIFPQRPLLEKKNINIINNIISNTTTIYLII
jgi:hypothetical protein